MADKIDLQVFKDFVHERPCKKVLRSEKCDEVTRAVLAILSVHSPVD